MVRYLSLLSLALVFVISSCLGTSGKRTNSDVNLLGSSSGSIDYSESCPETLPEGCTCSTDTGSVVYSCATCDSIPYNEESCTCVDGIVTCNGTEDEDDEDEDDNNTTLPTMTKPTFAYVNSSGTFLSWAADGAYPYGAKIRMASAENGTIYYTTNGNTPVCSGTAYSAPISLTVATNLKAIACKSGYNNSEVRSHNYTVTCTQDSHCNVNAGQYCDSGTCKKPVWMYVASSYTDAITQSATPFKSKGDLSSVYENQNPAGCDAGSQDTTLCKRARIDLICSGHKYRIATSEYNNRCGYGSKFKALVSFGSSYDNFSGTATNTNSVGKVFSNSELRSRKIKSYSNKVVANNYLGLLNDAFVNDLFTAGVFNSSQESLASYWVGPQGVISDQDDRNNETCASWTSDASGTKGSWGYRYELYNGSDQSKCNNEKLVMCLCWD